VSWFEANTMLALFGRIRADLLAPIGLVLALIVTVHVLLNKRDIGAAIGWIGLAWLSPIIGGIIYFVFGINRVRRRAQRARLPRRSVDDMDGLMALEGRDDHLAPLERAARRITRRPAQGGNRIAMFQNGDAAYPRMIEAIAAARRSVALSSYILRDDAAGGRFVDALIAARQRGLQVRVLIDGIGSGYFYSRAFRRLNAAGVPVARFMHSPLPWRMPFLNLRTHKKILVLDGAIGFAGGMNIAAENVLASKPRHPVRDTHFRIEGPVVAQLMEAFAADWEFVTREDGQQETLDGDLWFPSLPPVGEAVARVVTSGPDEDLEKIEYMVLQAIACARSSIRLMTPYFLPDERIVTPLAMAAMRGVQIDVVIPAQSNHRMVDWATRANVGPLLAQGVRIWLNPPPFDHSKLLVVDGEWCLIGSANWDMRSFRLNFELGVEVYHCDIGAELEAVMQACHGARLTSRDIAARSLPVRLRDAGTRLMLPYL
jgi:cardiolipin synthase